MATLAQREADPSLRAAKDVLRLRVIWPPDPEDGSPIALFLWRRPSVFEMAEALSVDGGMVVLALQTTALDVATMALEWAGDHAASLGADAGRLFVAGGGLAATAALHARDEGWPPLARQLLFGPERSGWPAADARSPAWPRPPWSTRRHTPPGCARRGSRSRSCRSPRG
jgi:alpha/beta hydrolase fold